MKHPIKRPRKPAFTLAQKRAIQEMIDASTRNLRQVVRLVDTWPTTKQRGCG